jgi:catechol 2,3-dioxygenase-like lactoylglutathione lyase family enzyme
VNVVKAAHAELIVADLDRAAAFYGGLLGLVETGRDAEALYYRGYEEREHHSLVLRRGGRPAVSHIAFRIARPDDLAVLEERFRARGRPLRRLPAGEERGQGVALRVQEQPDRPGRPPLPAGGMRGRLFHLAWDVACRSFGARQVLYERFFFGDPVRMMSALYNVYDKEPLMERVRAFLARDDAPST